MINVHKIMKVMGKMNTELLFPYPAMFELQCIDESIRSLVYSLGESAWNSEIYCQRRMWRQFQIYGRQVPAKTPRE